MKLLLLFYFLIFPMLVSAESVQSIRSTTNGVSLNLRSGDSFKLAEMLECEHTTTPGLDAPGANTDIEICNIEIPPGTWDLSATLVVNAGGGVIESCLIGLNTVSAVTPTISGNAAKTYVLGAANNNRCSASLQNQRINLTSTTTYYLNARPVGGGDPTDGFYGHMTAIRVAK